MFGGGALKCIPDRCTLILQLLNPSLELLLAILILTAHAQVMRVFAVIR